jgi:hypothetical protein
LLSLAIAIYASLSAALKKLTAENEDLKAKIRELEAGRAAPAADSSNSGIPPALDPFNRRTDGENQEEEPDCPEERAAGARKGHRRRLRSPFPTEGSEIRETDDFKGRTSPCCGAAMERSERHDERKDHYETDPAKSATRVIEQSRACRCVKCGKIHRSGKPAGGFRGGLLPVGLIAILLFLKACGHVSMRGLLEYLLVSHDIGISLGGLNKILKQAQQALRPVYLEILHAVKLQEHVHSDESPLPFKGRRLFAWVFRCAGLAAFAVGTRCSEMLKKVLGDAFNGIISCDAFTVYLSFAEGRPGVVLQLCLEHLKRDFVRCSQYDGRFPAVRAYGAEGVRLVRELIHNYNLLKALRGDGRGESPEAAGLEAKLHVLREQLTAHAPTAPKECSKARGIAKRFKEHPDYYFVFLDCPGVPPTNNFAEISLRGTVVLDRKVSYGSRSRSGNRFLETFWTLFSTAKLLGVKPTAFIEEALRAASEGRPLPSLLNPGKSVDPAYVAMAKEEARIDEANNALDKKLAEEKKKLAAAKKLAGPRPEDPPKEEGSGQPRRRGRPPKPAAAEPRRRGRPPKPAAAEPRRRGRPPKPAATEPYRNAGKAKKQPKTVMAVTGVKARHGERGTAEKRRRGRPPKAQSSTLRNAPGS